MNHKMTPSPSTRRRLIGLAMLATLVVTACSQTNGADPGDTTSTTAEVVEPLVWRTCGDVECTSLLVPYDYDKPSLGHFTLHITRRAAEGAAADYVGPLLVNPGGPGFGGSSLATDASYYFSQDIIDHFDIIGFDPRGTGESTPTLDCIAGNEFDKYFGADNTPNNDADLAKIVDLTKAFVDECNQKNGTFLKFLTTANTARDMDRIRQALGVEKISYFGFSYGSELGATWATMFPGTVRAAVLDGASDPNADAVDSGVQQAAGFEQSLTTFLTRCSENPQCAFYNGGKPEEAFDELMKKLDSKPLLVSADRARVNQTVALTGVAEAMYSENFWPQLESALASAQQGDGSGLLSLYDQYFQRNPDGSYGNELEAFIAISCADDPGPRSVKEVDSYNDRYLTAAPRLGVSFIHSYTCVFWPTTPDPMVDITGKDAGPIVVVGTTGDPATPYESTKNMAKALENGVLVTVKAEGHTGYGDNACVVDAVDSYLITTLPPKAGTTCE